MNPFENSDELYQRYLFWIEALRDRNRLLRQRITAKPPTRFQPYMAAWAERAYKHGSLITRQLVDHHIRLI